MDLDISMTIWGTDPPDTEVELQEIRIFSARGMRRVYSRADWYDRHHSFFMDIWRTRDGRLLMNCWTRCSGIDWWCFEIQGMDLSLVPEPVKGEVLQESWVPGAVRQAYDDWISEEF